VEEAEKKRTGRGQRCLLQWWLSDGCGNIGTDGRLKWIGKSGDCFLEKGFSLELGLGGHARGCTAVGTLGTRTLALHWQAALAHARWRWAMGG
jgi:hypothetical protein